MDPGILFAMIFAAIVMGVIFALGFSQIQDFFCIGSNAQTNKAVKDIESFVEEVFILSEGSIKSYPLSIPSDSKLCFINKTNPDPHPYTDPARTWAPDSLVLQNLLKNPNSSFYGSNVWIYRCGRPTGEGYKMKYLSPSKSFCSLRGYTLSIENKGRSVNIDIL